MEQTANTQTRPEDDKTWSVPRTEEAQVNRRNTVILIAASTAVIVGAVATVAVVQRHRADRHGRTRRALKRSAGLAAAHALLSHVSNED